MLRPAHIGHLALLRSLIRDAARDGAFDPALAWDSAAASRFFGELRQALKTGYFVVEDPKSGTVSTVAVPGYVYWADETAGSEPPIGFGLFRAVDDGYELWLAGLETHLRGKGHGRAMLQALFSTPTGARASHSSCARSASKTAPAASRGHGPCRAGAPRVRRSTARSRHRRRETDRTRSAARCSRSRRPNRRNRGRQRCARCPMPGPRPRNSRS